MTENGAKMDSVLMGYRKKPDAGAFQDVSQEEA